MYLHTIFHAMTLTYCTTAHIGTQGLEGCSLCQKNVGEHRQGRDEISHLERRIVELPEIERSWESRSEQINDSKTILGQSLAISVIVNIDPG